MEAPTETPEDCKVLMSNCWKFLPGDRYNFQQIKEKLTNIKATA